MLRPVFDCHVHTQRSACGEDITDQWLCQKARENKVQFAVTDHTMHLYYEPEIAWALAREDCVELFEQRRKQGRDNLLRYFDDIRACEAENMLVGVELDVLPDGQLMFPDDLRGELDIMVGGLHFLPSIRRKAPAAEVLAEYRQQMTWQAKYGVDVIAHPFRILLGAGYEVDQELVEWVVDLAAEYGAALEINSHKQFRDHDVLMARLAVASGVPLAIGTDAHNTREFGKFTYHRNIFKRAGLTTDELEDLLYCPEDALPL